MFLVYSYEKFVDILKGGYILKLIKILNVIIILKLKRKKVRVWDVMILIIKYKMLK